MKFTILLLFSLFSFTVTSQSISGLIIDPEGEPIVSANVSNVNSGYHTHSDEYGRFTLNQAELGDSLDISHLLYDGRTIVVGGFNDLNIVLQEREFRFKNIVIKPDVNTTKHISDIDTKINPVNNSQQLLSKVPGLFIGQHAGGGKAEQIFLRGFDIDHGTDISIDVDGVPVNMVSHAHGQGYADLHFLIPETVDRVAFDKGPYYTERGNFNTAGFIDFTTKSKLKHNTVTAEYGQFNNLRVVSLLDIISKEKSNFYIATEYNIADGYFESSQNFERINLFGKYSTAISDHEFLSVTASFFDSEWTASGQIPERAVSEGLITRFGAIDDTEGGRTGRTNIKLDYSRQLSDNVLIKNKLYYTRYNFELFSNFTFFANDPLNGDQIKQFEIRDLFGLKSDLEYDVNPGLKLKSGIAIRKDRSKDSQLAHTLNRNTLLENYRIGDIDETNASAYFSAEWRYGNLVLSPGLRADVFIYRYEDELTPNYVHFNSHGNLVTPKLVLTYQIDDGLQLFGKVGQGFHSNDTRVVLENNNPKLPRATGIDIGLNWKALPNLIFNSALWQLHLEQEFVYVGDEGIVEPSGETMRRGVDFGVRYQLFDWLYASADMNFTTAKSTQEPEGSNRIPLAPKFTLESSVTVDHHSGWFCNLNTRHMGDRAANEDNSIIAEGYTVFDASVGRSFGNVDVSIKAQNIFGVDWNETQFATASRLFNEPEVVEEIHFTPGTPFNFSVKLACRF